MLGALLVMISNTTVKPFRKNDRQHFVRNCVWGTEYGERGPEREWAVAPFDHRYGLQSKSLIQLICQSEIDERVRLHWRRFRNNQ